MQTSQLFGLSILSVKKQELFTFFDQFLAASAQTTDRKTQQTLTVFTPNPEQIVIAQNDRLFAANLAKADLLLPDGIGLVIAARILKFFGKTKHSIKERITGVEVVEHLLVLAEQKNLQTLIIGGRDYVGSFEGEAFEDQQSLKKIKKNVYWTEAYQEKAAILPIEEASLKAIIEQLQPTLIFVALGAPDQEQWIVNHRSLMQANGVHIAMAVGGSFDFIFAKVKRAPLWMQRSGLEWLWRLIRQPWRRHRQLRLLKFLTLLWREIIA